ncbi:hypothetical protein ACFQ0G_25505 [Streptomyces chiangmaiensis]
MPQAVLALGVAAVTASGCVWYMPALADLRAGADRPVSRRRAAAACVSGWSTAGTVAVLLLLAEAWWIPRAAAVVGGLVSAGLRIRAAVLRRNEAGKPPASGASWATAGRCPRPTAPGTSWPSSSGSDWRLPRSPRWSEWPRVPRTLRTGSRRSPLPPPSSGCFSPLR